jgi:hypothetical protein
VAAGWRTLTADTTVVKSGPTLLVAVLVSSPTTGVEIVTVADGAGGSAVAVVQCAAGASVAFCPAIPIALTHGLEVTVANDRGTALVAYV